MADSEVPDALRAAADYGGDRDRGERRARGQFGTPPAIARALARWAIQPHDAGDPPVARDAGDFPVPRVLDPAVGGGVFALAAVERLRELAGTVPEGSVAAVDVDPGALAACERVLGDARRAVALREADFLALDPDDLGRFDAVVGNPPFVRQEALDKERARRHLAAFGPDGETPVLDGDRAIDRRSDAYVYFLTNATRFLRAGGRLGVVVPTKWLDTRYGERLQRFLLDHHRVHAVVGFSARAFDDALVDACLLCCERRPDRERRQGDVRFVRTATTDADDLVAAIRGREFDDRAAATRRDGESGDEAVAARRDGEPDDGAAAATQAVTVGQATLADRGPGKLAHYLDAPPGIVDLLDADGLVPLGDLASVAYGYKTGANDFFFLDPDAPVDDRFRSPAVTSFREVDGPVLDGDPPAEVLDVHDYVERVAAERDDGRDAGATGNTGDAGAAERGAAAAEQADDGAAAGGGEGDTAGESGIGALGEAVLAAMAADGYDATVEYVRAGAREGYADRTTCAARRVWFDLGPLSPPAVLHPKFFDERIAVVHNRGGFVPSNAIDCLRVREGVPVEPLLGVLNSSLHAAMLECRGRSEGGGALQVMTYELQRVPVLDVRALAEEERERIADGFRALAAGDDDARQPLDAAVLDVAGVDATPADVRAWRTEMVERRVERGC